MNPNFPENLAISPSSWTDYESAHRPPLFFGSARQKESIRRYGIAGRVWEAAYALNFYIESPPGWEFDPPFLSRCLDHQHVPKPLCRSTHTILELGSGTGVVAQQLAERLGAVSTASEARDDLIIVTDLPEVCPLLEENLSDSTGETYNGVDHAAHTSRSRLVVRPLTWGNREDAHKIGKEFGLFTSSSSTMQRRLSHIICSDLVYFPSLLAPLLRTLLDLTGAAFVHHDGETDAERAPIEVVISGKIRSLPKETPFWSAFGLYFDFAPVLVRRRDLDEGDIGEWRRFGSTPEGDAFVFVACRRPESMAWVIPEDDGGLLAGVGARGTQERKADDTFETLLLMGLDEF